MHRHDDQLYGLLSMCDEEFVPPLSHMELHHSNRPAPKHK